MSPKTLFSAALIGLASFFVSSNTLAFEDYCTPKLDAYLSNVQKTVDSKYVSQRQKEVAQKILDRVKASRDDTGDCVLVDKLLP
jgi:ABC-type transport system substrate-binding protein